MYLERTEELDGRRVLLFPWEGRDIRVYDDAETALRIMALFDGPETPHEKLYGAICGLFADESELAPVRDLSGLIAAVCWECLCLDVDGSHEDETGGEKVMDWEADFDYIAPSLLMCYGVGWDEAIKRYSYRQLVNMVAMVERETPMGQALHYRTATPPEPNKYNAEERRAFQRARDFWRLREPGKKDAYESVNDKMNDAFAGLERLAKG